MKLYVKYFILSFIAFSITSCTEKEVTYPNFEPWQAYDESKLIEESQLNENESLRYKLLQSKVLDKNELLENIRLQLDGFTEAIYLEKAPLIFEKDMLYLQQQVEEGKLTYKLITQWYLYRIAITETNPELGLNAIIAINPNAVAQAEKLDENLNAKKHPVYGMPILLKDNINTAEMKTTAGAVFLKDNQTEEDAEIVSNLKSNGAIILGKANLSEWANYLCAGCPNGYSAVGGQTLNPYHPRKFDTGGSSSGSAVSVAANYAVAAVGTETSGSILSPSSQQSLVGLKPTLLNLSQEGIVPISSTLDTPGPITKNVSDNAILYNAMQAKKNELELSMLDNIKPKEIKLGAIEAFMQDSLYQTSVKALEKQGFVIEYLTPKQMNFDGFLSLLNGDMKRDLASYLAKYAKTNKLENTVEAVVKFNKTDSLVNIPYGQARLDGIVAQELTDQELDRVRQRLINEGKKYFEPLFEEHQLDAILSINNYNAGQAALGKYPALTIPMGYSNEGEPKGLTFIAKPNQEKLLFQLAHFFEQIENLRISPKKYQF
jgi:amidase